jgi:hypothetical protein
MTLGDDEAILGFPGTEIDEAPRSPYGPLVSGDRFFQWERNYKMIVSVRRIAFLTAVV